MKSQVKASIGGLGIFASVGVTLKTCQHVPASKQNQNDSADIVLFTGYRHGSKYQLEAPDICLSNYTMPGCVSLKESELTFSNLVKSRSRDIVLYNQNMALTFDMPLRISTAEPPVKFHSHPVILSMDLAASRLDEIWERQLTFLRAMHLTLYRYVVCALVLGIYD